MIQQTENARYVLVDLGAVLELLTVLGVVSLSLAVLGIGIACACWLLGKLE